MRRVRRMSRTSSQCQSAHSSASSHSSGSPLSGVTGTLLSSQTDAAVVKSAPFGHALIRAAERNPRIVGLTADLGKYTDIHLFAERFPNRFFNVGMAEQNLIGVAAGLARTGLVPFATTY